MGGWLPATSCRTFRGDAGGPGTKYGLGVRARNEARGAREPDLSAPSGSQRPLPAVSPRLSLPLVLPVLPGSHHADARRQSPEQQVDQVLGWACVGGGWGTPAPPTHLPPWGSAGSLHRCVSVSAPGDTADARFVKRRKVPRTCSWNVCALLFRSGCDACHEEARGRQREKGLPILRDPGVRIFYKSTAN